MLKPIIYLLMLIPIVNALEITEIMYDPEGSDNNNEYLEILTNENLTDYIIEDSASSDLLKQIKYFESNLSLIVEEDFNHSNINATIYSAGSNIGNNLNNDQDIIIIRNKENKPLDVIKYSKSFGASGNGKSLCISNNKIEECPSSPGYITEEENLTEEFNFTLIISEILPDPEGYDNASIPEGEFIELYNYGDKEINLENFIIKDESNKTITISRQNVLNSTIIYPNSYLTIYVNGLSGFLNNDKDVIAITNNDAAIDQFSYSYTQEGMSISKINNLFINTIPTPNNENINNSELLESKINIKKIKVGKDKAIKFGEVIYLDLDIYKGNTSKETIEAFIKEKDKSISKRTKINMPKKFSNLTVTIPIQINSNCKNSLKGAKYDLIVEGLEKQAAEKIFIAGQSPGLCEIIKEKPKEIKGKKEKVQKEVKIKTELSKKEKAPEKIINAITAQTVYESSSVKAKNAILYLFNLAMFILLVCLILGK